MGRMIINIFNSLPYINVILGIILFIIALIMGVKRKNVLYKILSVILLISVIFGIAGIIFE